MNADKYLRQLKSREIMIQRGIERIKEMELALLPSGISYDGIRVQTSPTDKMSDGVARICDEIRKLEKRVAEDSRKKREVEAVVAQLDPVKMDIVYYRYRDSMMFTEISQKIGYSYPQTRRLHKQLLREVEVIINENGKEDPGSSVRSTSDSWDDSDGLPDHSES